ncbi:uncharacterized protein LOC107410285 isoform X2 [Ziziphus jujuba]|uniref:Uncharacterized protein LOC107410285 isoform X2 n=1 Tax=Ziziphus jujuba TaxID=326968 RepID=A0A6P3ZEL8_ZIZJJ|nr:uncharacterized protein LOC107410285 isoform X2 [Ziziphus jujuba]
MKPFKKPHLLNAFLILLLNINYLSSSTAREDVQFIKFCGKHQIQTPFVQKSSNLSSSPIKDLVLCISQKLYYRTSIGLFPISSINYTTKTLTISHPSSCSSSLHYVSPSILSAGFPSPPSPNSLLVFNCSNSKHHFPPYIRNHTCLNACGGSTSSFSSCLVIEDLGKLPMGFHPRDLNCTHYSRVYKKSSDDGYELGTRISFDIPDHVPVPDICSECQKPNGNCGVGLKCMCHLKDCNKVVSKGKSMKNSVGNMLVTLLSFVAVIVLRS